MHCVQEKCADVICANKLKVVINLEAFTIHILFNNNKYKYMTLKCFLQQQGWPNTTFPSFMRLNGLQVVSNFCHFICFSQTSTFKGPFWWFSVTNRFYRGQNCTNLSWNSYWGSCDEWGEWDSEKKPN